MNPWVVFLFWFSVALLGYTYVGYPLLIWVAAFCRRTRLDREPWQRPISVVLVAHNEGARIARKLDSIFASDCQSRFCEVVVASDGSTDDTALVAQAYPDDRVKVVAFPERRGKPACLNELIPECTADIVVLTDVRQELDPAAIRQLCENFADVRVGVASGELVLRQPGHASAAARGIGAYWQYEKFIRKCESRFRSVPGATGAFYAIRRNVFRPIPAQTILDDVAIPMRIIAKGYHCAFDPAALAYDEASRSHEQESVRKRRTIAGCLQLLKQTPDWLDPRANPIWWEFVSHKVLRLLSPWLLVIIAVTNAVLVAHDPYFYLMALQGVLYLLAALGWHYQRSGQGSRIGGTLLMFVALNVTTVTAWWDAFRGRFSPTWRRAT
ncbi:MAG: glycosyltransferase family 2 protein [Planctomycetaceae bacterium]|nr:glycosyltransferase family 2 protein [Planctomycetaceae bacterium]